MDKSVELQRCDYCHQWFERQQLKYSKVGNQIVSICRDCFGQYHTEPIRQWHDEKTRQHTWEQLCPHCERNTCRFHGTNCLSSGKEPAFTDCPLLQNK